MKSYQLIKGRVIDFEGSRKTGIQQASFIDFNNFEVIQYGEFLSSDGKFLDWLIENNEDLDIDYWVAHNSNVERNLIREHAPYRPSTGIRKQELSWGPWVDTLTIYKKLYPDLDDYSLQCLGKKFLLIDEIDKVAQRLCLRTKKTYHQSMFDCVVTFLLTKRIKNLVNLSLFLC